MHTNNSSLSFQAESFGDPYDLAYFHHATLIEKVHISLLRLPQALFGVISQSLPSWNSVKVGGRKQVCWIIQYFRVKIHLGDITDNLMQKRRNSSALAMELRLPALRTVMSFKFVICGHVTFHIRQALQDLISPNSVQIHLKHYLLNNLSHWLRPCLAMERKQNHAISRWQPSMESSKKYYLQIIWLYKMYSL